MRAVYPKLKIAVKKIRSQAELVFWLASLILLFLMKTEKDPSLCIFRFIGFSHCPGCGLGHAIHYALHLHFALSFDAHIFGMPSVFIMLYRVKQLSFTKKSIAYAT